MHRSQDGLPLVFDLFSVGVKLAEVFSHRFKQPPPISIFNLSGMFRSCMCWLFANLGEHNVLKACSMIYDITSRDKEQSRLINMN